jgi:predicted dinucleotide-binding enzyme
MEISAAIKEADIIVFAIWYNAIKEVLKQYASELREKLLLILPIPLHRMIKEV